MIRCLAEAPNALLPTYPDCGNAPAQTTALIYHGIMPSGIAAPLVQPPTPKHDAAMSAIRSALDDPPEGMNDHERKIVGNIRETGWQGTHVLSGEESCGFGYSTGFWVTAGIAEILICSLPSNVAHSILGYILERADAGFVPPVGVAVSDLMVGYDCYFFPICKEAYADYPLSSNWFYHGVDYPCLQLVWADEAGLFPWQPGFNERFRDDQPDLSPDGWLSHLAN